MVYASLPHLFHQVCTEYASAIAGLTRAATAAAAPSSLPQALLVHRDARQSVPPSSSYATEQPAADPEEPAPLAPLGVKNMATDSLIADADEIEQERIATAAASSVQRGETGRGEGLELEKREEIPLHQGFPLGEALPMQDSSAGIVVGDSTVSDIGDSSAAGLVVHSAADNIRGSAAGVIRDSATGERRDRATGVEGIPAGIVFDAVLTSPPYPGVYDYLGHARSARSQLGALPRPNMTPSRPAESTSARRPEGRLADAATVVIDDGNDDNLAACQGKGGPEIDLAASEGGVSMFIDSAVPSGRNWPSNWTDGEIGAKSEVRRRARRNAAFSGLNPAEAGQGVSLERAGFQAEKGGEISESSRKWADDQKEWLVATTRVLKSGGGRMAVMVGDGDGVDTRSSLVEGVEELGRSKGEEELGLRVVGWATLRAAKDARRSMRTEHVILLERS